MKKYLCVLGLSLSVLGSCSSDKADLTVDDKTITANDFESMAGWNNDPAALDRGRAHSGQYAIKVDGGHEFSPTFDMPLAMASTRKFRTIVLEGWAYLPSSNATGILGIQIMDPVANKELFGSGIKLADEVKTYKKWTHVSKEIVLPDNINATQHIRMSLWRANSSDVVLVDDVKISIKE